MGYRIDIHKIKEENNIHYYHVDTSSSLPFYIGIDPQKNCAYYYYTNDFSKPVWTSSFCNPDEPFPKIERLAGKATGIAMLQAKDAIKKMNFLHI